MTSPEQEEASGVSLPLLTRVAVLATIVGRGVAPAIPGLAVGIAPFIVLSGRVSALLSQLVAAGGVAAAIRLAYGALRLPKLDLGYRLIGLPGAAVVVALVMAAWARPLDPELCRAMALATIASALAGTIASVRVSETRAAGLVLGCASLSGMAHLLSRELMARAAERPDATLRWAVLVTSLALLLDLCALGFALTSLGRGKPRQVAVLAAGVLIPAFALAAFAAHGMDPGAGVLRVLAGRSLSQLSRAPAASPVRFAITSAVLLAAGLCVLKPGARGKAGVVMSLSLLSLGAPDMPLPALWLVVAALLSPEQLPPAPMEGERVVGRST